MTITRQKPLLSTGTSAETSEHLSEAELLGAAADAPAEMCSLLDFEEAARKKMSPMAYEYLASGAADELTLRWNRESLEKIRLRPRVLVDVSKLDTRVTLFGQELAFPILLAPTALHRLYHAEGELATARGAGVAAATYRQLLYDNASRGDSARGDSTSLVSTLCATGSRFYQRRSTAR